ncbi:type 2 lanthipeptide synthetase LanM family protein [Priestia megaterium]|uniref:type 2 lanthipeptide synthetase LanM family protein n=1 Tax=Priestia megaterium TaxID=1404 RepID=UPI003F7F478C
MENKETIKQSLFIHERKIDNKANTELGKQKLKFWSESSGFEIDQFNEVNKALSNINEEELLNLASTEIIEEEFQINQEKWFLYIEELLSEKHSDITIPKLIFENFDSMGNNISFIGFLKPFLKTALGRLSLRIDIIKKKYNMVLSPIHEELEAILLYHLINQLVRICYRTLILELNVARVSGQLKGDTGEERYKYFEEVLLNDKEYLNSIYTEYPVLIRLMATKCEFWIQNIEELFDRLENDKQLISKTMYDNKPLGDVKNVEMGLSDSHCEGRTVSVLTFTSGFKVVYKPRPLHIDSQFQNFLKWVNANNNESYPHYEMKVINCNSYGWVEFIKSKPCFNKNEIERFYERIGSQLALLYAMNATDFHYENLIASSEYPVLIDLESLFHQKYTRSSRIKTAYEKVSSIVEHSVLSTGMLPSLVVSKNSDNNADLSGLGEVKEQLYPKKVSGVEEKNKDTMQVVRKYVKISGGNNTPTLNNEKINLTDYIKNIEKGFENTYRWIVNNKESFKMQMELFSEIEVRHIPRPTERYGELLNISTHPDFLRDSLDREMLLNKLWIDSIIHPELKIILQSEKKDLLDGDIPYFTTKPSKPHLWDSKGNCSLNFFDKDCLSETLDKIKQLSLEDCKEQLNVIRLSMLAVNSEEERHKNRFTPSIKPLNSNSPNPKEFLDEAIKIGDYLLAKSISGINEEEEDLCWIGTNLVGINEVQWRLAALGTDLYDGVSGMAMFFGYLASITGEERFKEASKKALVPVRRALKYINADYENPDIGAFTGVGSCIYAMQHLSVILEEPELLDEVSNFLPKLIKMIPKDNSLDIIGGSAGTLIVLLDFYRLTKDKLALDCALLCGERLIETSERIGEGVGWRVSVSTEPLAGFAHGVAGIIWSLAELFKETKDERFTELVKKGLIYERSLFIKERKNWAKLTEKDGNVPAAWCHGAPGIVLSRLLLDQSGVKDSLLEEEIELGVETTLQEGFGADHSLCHGDFGNIDIINFASEILDKDEWKVASRNAASITLEEIRKMGWRCGLSRNCETTGLMVGLAGIGFGLLQQYNPFVVPSILRLQSPILQSTITK